jgi:Gpi18-like mannosyltransferase
VTAAVVLLLCGLWIRWPIITYDGPLHDLVNYSVGRLAYSDIATLYFRDGLASQPRPYLDYSLEYPVGVGLLIYLLNLAAPTLHGYFLLSLLVLSVCGIVVARLIEHFPRGRVWLFALSPSLALYVGLNWDMWSILYMVASLLLFVRERDGWGAAVFAAAVWTKFFPIVFLPFLLLDRLQHQGWRAAAKVAGIFALCSTVINAPLLLAAPEGFWHFFQFNASRGGF